MKFFISRSSNWNDEADPEVENAIKETLTNEIGRPYIKWSIEINTLDEFVRFYEKYGDLVIGSDFHNPAVLMIEIYDDYRE